MELILCTGRLWGIRSTDCNGWPKTEDNRVINDILAVVLTEKPEYHCDTQQVAHDNGKKWES
jgi:hypothetical protein